LQNTLLQATHGAEASALESHGVFKIMTTLEAIQKKIGHELSLNLDKPKNFGDLNCNAAMILAKEQKRPPREIAEELKTKFEKELKGEIEKIEIAGAGFINITLSKKTWHKILNELLSLKKDFYSLTKTEPKHKFLIECVSANPTGPLHLGHGRNGIIGDVLAKVCNFLGHKADKEYYINNAGNQMVILGQSLRARCQQQLGQAAKLPENGYQGEYLVEVAAECVKQYGGKVLEQEDSFFETYAEEHLLEQIKETLDDYRITFDRWFSEKILHKDGEIEKVLKILHDKDLLYEKDDALWFCSTKFGDDKDRVIKKNDGLYTYIAADIAYHKDKFDRGYDILIDILGQDHHSYVTRLKATMQALGYTNKKLDAILYQLVTIKQSGEQIRMSKRAGTFETLHDIIEKVGTDVARFFYLNRKADSHLEFDLDVALKRTEENPVYYIQYAYVRTNSIFEKASEHEQLKNWSEIKEVHLGNDDIDVIKKACALRSLLRTIASNYQTHLLSYYTLELARLFHTYYAKNKVIDLENIELSKSRLLIVSLVQQTINICLDLLGISKPKSM
jgi:arginyl-tRNA synthetase